MIIRTDKHLWHVQFVYNNAYNQAIKDIPMRVAYGYLPHDSADGMQGDSDNNRLRAEDLSKLLQVIKARILDRLEENRIQMEIDKNDKRKKVTFEPGELVLVLKKRINEDKLYQKLASEYSGPFKVLRKINDNAYEIDLPTNITAHKVINVQYLKKYYVRNKKYTKKPPDSRLEARDRVNEIIAIQNYNEEEDVYECQLEQVHPEILVKFSEEDLELLPPQRRNELLGQFQQRLQDEEPLTSTDTSGTSNAKRRSTFEEGEEDVMKLKEQQEDKTIKMKKQRLRVIRRALEARVLR